MIKCSISSYSKALVSQAKVAEFVRTVQLWRLQDMLQVTVVDARFGTEYMNNNAVNPVNTATPRINHLGVILHHPQKTYTP